MKTTLISFACILISWFNSTAQTGSYENRSDSSISREFVLHPLRIEGEVENPGIVGVSALPLRSILVKELGVDDSAGQRFRGAFIFSGYSLYDILKTMKVDKSNKKEFSPTTDLYVIVENDNNQRTVVSWGEIFSPRNRFQILVSKSVESINPSKVKTRQTLPTESGLICANDLYNVRYISNPTTIIVRSFSGSFVPEKPNDIYSPEIRVVVGSRTSTVGEMRSSVEQRTYTSVGYGHGMGYKGVQTVKGFVLKDVLQEIIKPTIEDYRASLAVVSAKDGYRAVFSTSEIFNRNDNQDFLLIDQKDSKKDGRYSLFASPDFFVDRNVKAIEKVDIVNSDSLR